MNTNIPALASVYAASRRGLYTLHHKRQDVENGRKGDHTDSPKAGAPELEITPAMIAAGAGEICGFDLQDAFESPSIRNELIARVFRAMFEAL